ncbi:MAG TPA: tRNA pseudouridine(65) synthase TruC [Sulfurimonas sp.]|nr:tRNA pseudouridine(65) synthase TruC [Sulfurimonas sp.]
MDEEESLEILYQDEHLVAVNKPSGLLVHRSWIDKYETRFALQILREQIGQYVYPVHRLDKPTSGVLLFALSKEIARDLSLQIQEGIFEKEYLAVVRGYTDDKAKIDYALKEVLDKMTDAKANTDKEAQEAITSYKKLSQIELPFAVGKYVTTRYSLLKLSPTTGRKHQLRRHMKDILHPIVGDTKYGRHEHNVFFREKYNSHRLLLHASKLSIIHPISQRPLVFEAGLDEVFHHVLKECQLEY